MKQGYKDYLNEERNKLLLERQEMLLIEIRALRGYFDARIDSLLHKQCKEQERRDLEISVDEASTTLEKLLDQLRSHEIQTVTFDNKAVMLLIDEYERLKTLSERHRELYEGDASDE